MQITASMVKELRERSGAGMMDCKKALAQTDGDMEAAIALMRKSGAAQADKKAGRVAAEGQVITQVSEDASEGVIVEINCETDFVAKDANFQAFADAVVACVLRHKPADVEALKSLILKDGEAASVEQTRQELVAKIGENIQIRRFEVIRSKGGRVSSYIHGVSKGVLVDITGADEALAKDVAMHIVASRPICISEAQVPQEMLDKEKEILIAQAESSGKPAEIIEKMIQGRIKKYLAEITLLGQPFVKDPDITVEKLLKGAGATLAAFVRFEVGEGIEKKTENFAEEVMAQVRGS